MGTFSDILESSENALETNELAVSQEKNRKGRTDTCSRLGLLISVYKYYPPVSYINQGLLLVKYSLLRYFQRKI